MTSRILLVDDDPMLLKALLRLLTRAGGFMVTTADSEAVALDFIAHDNFDLVLTDLELGGGGSGLNVVAACRSAGLPVILQSGSFTEDNRPRGVTTFDKPADSGALLDAVRDLIR